MKKKKIKNLHIRVSGGVNVSGSPFLAPKTFDCIITNDEIGKTLSFSPTGRLCCWGLRSICCRW